MAEHERPDIVWEDPPTPKRDPIHDFVDATLVALKDRPGTWALVWTGGANGTDIRRKLLRAAGCEVQGARAEDSNANGSRRRLYARWIAT